MKQDRLIAIVIAIVIVAAPITFAASVYAQDSTGADASETRALSERLARLAEHVENAETRTAAFWEEQSAARDMKLEELKASAASAKENWSATLDEATDDISTAWAAVSASAEEKARAVSEQIADTRDVVNLSMARSRAERLERNAEYAIGHALVAIRDAELAVAAAMNARLVAMELEAKASE